MLHFGFPNPASNTMSSIDWLHNFVMSFVGLVFVFVLYIFIITFLGFFFSKRFVFRFFWKLLKGNMNKQVVSFIIYFFPSRVIIFQNRKTTHSFKLEIIWTVIPGFILFIIALPSFKLLYLMDECYNPRMTIKIMGYQWYWGVEYATYSRYRSYSWNMVQQSDLEIGLPYLLKTDRPLVFLLEVPLRILVTAKDVIHSFSLPALGIKQDGIPGRLNQVPVTISRAVTTYGQCSELCGAGHAVMPITVKTITAKDYLFYTHKN